MRVFYSDEGPLDTLLQIAAGPVWDGDLVSKQARQDFISLGWVRRQDGQNILTGSGQKVISALKLSRQRIASEKMNNLRKAFAENNILWPFR